MGHPPAVVTPQAWGGRGEIKLEMKSPPSRGHTPGPLGYNKKLTNTPPIQKSGDSTCNNIARGGSPCLQKQQPPPIRRSRRNKSIVEFDPTTIIAAPTTIVAAYPPMAFGYPNAAPVTHCLLLLPLLHQDQHHF